MIARERYGWYRGHGLDYDEGTWQWLEQAAGPDTPLDGTVADGETIDLGGIAVEIVALPGHSPGTCRCRSPRFAHADRDGRGARTRPLHDLRRADQPASVRICRRLPGNDRTSAIAATGPARHQPLRADRGRRGGDGLPRRVRVVRRRPRRGRHAELGSRAATARALLAGRRRRASARSARWRSSSPDRSAPTSTTLLRKGAPSASDGADGARLWPAA